MGLADVRGQIPRGIAERGTARTDTWLRHCVTLASSGVLQSDDCTAVFGNGVPDLCDVFVKMQMEIGCGCESSM